MAGGNVGGGRRMSEGDGRGDEGGSVREKERNLWKEGGRKSKERRIGERGGAKKGGRVCVGKKSDGGSP